MLAKLGFTNIMGTITAILAVVTTILSDVFHCSPGATDLAATCSVSWLPPALMGWLTIIAGVVYFIGKLTRPGGILSSLFGPVAVVVPTTSANSVAGTATPEHVLQP